MINLRTVRFFVVAAMLAGFAAGAVKAQLPTHFPLKDKTIAVWFSKKHFTYDDSWLMPLSGFVQADREVAPLGDDLKLLTLASLGRLFTSGLAAATQADSVFFLNENLTLAPDFVGLYRADQHYMPALDTSFSRIDYIVVVNPLTLGSYKTTQVFTRSNRILTEQVVKKSGKLRLDVYDPETGYLLGIFEGCYSEQDAVVPRSQFDFNSEESTTGRFLSLLFSSAVNNLNEGVKTNCQPR